MYSRLLKWNEFWEMSNEKSCILKIERSENKIKLI